MKLLLTSGGVTNPTIHQALVDLLPRALADCTALAIPSAQWGHPHCTPTSARNFAVDGTPPTMTGLGWRSVGLLELTALPTIDPERWIPWVREADVLLVDGGDATYLAHWLRASGLADLLPELTGTVWVGVSAGSMVMTPRIGEDFTSWRPPAGSGASSDTLGLVDFSIFPHLDHPMMPENTMAVAERWREEVDGPAYVLDDQSAVRVVDGTVDVVSEGQWRHLP
ncbi:Type 1 glutamine amidotransferase-like domain-containing protein [Nocardioides sp. KIGAM211]|uniref:Type 1 glutamine amidotransferase-like domain-containing protein n=1 Tax=Nocardioides luti TaxID=2761101 RepID=A0A7X0RD65_9ACTN|nr:Type 1 glutamine amidotransferase-like domain-containing protein [Nocardioides luti]MBB6626057.1 Type 1 glutamine amidotransferase-like domain-containing protein [Nocardioides luti]